MGFLPLNKMTDPQRQIKMLFHLFNQQTSKDIKRVSNGNNVTAQE